MEGRIAKQEVWTAPFLETAVESTVHRSLQIADRTEAAEGFGSRWIGSALSAAILTSQNSCIVQARYTERTAKSDDGCSLGTLRFESIP